MLGTDDARGSDDTQGLDDTRGAVDDPQAGDEAADELAQGAPGDDFGWALREARLAAGLSVGDVANALKVTDRTINAIEAERYEDLPPKPYVRATFSDMPASSVWTRMPSHSVPPLRPKRQRSCGRSCRDRDGRCSPISPGKAGAWCTGAWYWYSSS